MLLGRRVSFIAKYIDYETKTESSHLTNICELLKLWCMQTHKTSNSVSNQIVLSGLYSISDDNALKMIKTRAHIYLAP